MHERSLVRRLLTQVEELMAEHDADRVEVVRLSVGEFSGVDPALLRTAFHEMAADTPVGDARLQLEVVPLEATCDLCGHRFAVSHFVFECPRCSWQHVTVLQGEQLVLESLLLEESDHEQAQTNGKSA